MVLISLLGKIDIMILIILLALCHPLFAIKFNFTEYTHVSQTFDETVCLTGCSSDYECYINWDWEKRNCRSFDIAPIYRTARKVDPLRKYCLSNCGYFGEDFEWCITTEDLKWDYCSSYESKSFMPTGDPVATTIRGEKCSDPCRWYDEEKYFWCHYENYDGNAKWDYCAPPALPRVPVLGNHFDIGHKKKGNCDGFLKYISNPDTFATSDAADDYVTSFADAMEESTVENLLTEVIKVRDPNSPIDGYTMINVGNISVPVVIRAHITNKMIKDNLSDELEVSEEIVRKLREQMTDTTSGYEAGLLIGAQLGGPTENYNVVPRSLNWKNGGWWDMELAIKKWCQTTGGSVDMTVVVFYIDSDTPIPEAFGVSLIFKNEDNSLFVGCREKIHFTYY